MATLDPLVSATSVASAVPVADVEACPSCGAALGGGYCPACGEKRLREEHFSVRHFVGELWGEVFDLDSRALRSLRTLLLSPGTLTLEYLRGQLTLALSTDDAREGVAAFLERREPRWTGS